MSAAPDRLPLNEAFVRLLAKVAQQDRRIVTLAQRVEDLHCELLLTRASIAAAPTVVAHDR